MKIKKEIQILHQKALEISRCFRQCESELIDILQEMDDKKAFCPLGYSSLFDYAVKALKLSEANASNFITVARKSKEVPELKAEIKKGAITVSKARKIVPVLKKTNKSEWLGKAIDLPTRKLEKEVAKLVPQTAVSEKAKYVTDTRLELRMGVSEDLMNRFKRAQDLVSTSTKRPARLEDTLEELLNFYIQRKDPVQKADRNIKRKENRMSRDTLENNKGDKKTQLGGRFYPTPSIDCSLNSRKPHRKPLVASVRHQLFQRDHGKCQFKLPDGSVCGQSRWTHFHHKVPVAIGGQDSLENLVTLCANHHRRIHNAC